MIECGLHMGDAYELIKLVPNNSVDLIVTDPPYEIDYTARKLPIEGVDHFQQLLMGHSENLIKGIDLAILDEFVRVLKNPNMYIFCSKKQLPKYLNWAVANNYEYDVLVYCKSNSPPMCNNKYLNDKEYCVYICGAGAFLDTEKGKLKTVFGPYAIPLPESYLYNHPTIKPMDMIETLIKNSSRENDLVLDPFMGSGTTAIAANNTGRRWLGFEIDEYFYGVCRNRLKGITQKDIIGNYEQLKLDI